MQVMLGIYEFPDDEQAAPSPHRYPKQFDVDYIRGYRPAKRQPAGSLESPQATARPLRLAWMAAAHGTSWRRPGTAQSMPAP
jgi:hypothetical protein